MLGVCDAGYLWWLACNYRTPKADKGFPRTRGLASLATMTNSVLNRETLPSEAGGEPSRKTPKSILGFHMHFHNHVPTHAYTHVHICIYTHIHGKVKEQSMLTVCQNQKITMALLTP